MTDRGRALKRLSLGRSMNGGGLNGTGAGEKSRSASPPRGLPAKATSHKHVLMGGRVPTAFQLAQQPPDDVKPPNGISSPGLSAAHLDESGVTGQQRSKLMNIVNRGKNIFKRSDETASVFDSDDDDALSSLNESQFEKKAARGIIEFKCFHVKPMGAKKRVFHLDIAANTMTQHMPSGRSKTFDLDTIVSVSKGKDAQVTVVVKENVRQLTKRYTFHSQEDASRYYEYVEFSRACGKTLRQIFEDIDKTRVGRITILSLRRKMEAEDIPATDEELDRMLNLSDVDGNGEVDYSEFYHIFLGNPIYSMRQCLTEWLSKARTQAQTISYITAATQLSGPVTVEPPPLMAGEFVMQSVPQCRWAIHGRQPVPALLCTMFLTNYRLLLVSTSRAQRSETRVYSRNYMPPFFDVLSVPYPTISKVQQTAQTAFCVTAKDNRVVTIQVAHNNEHVCEGVVRMLTSFAFPGTILSLFAFVWKGKEHLVNKWDIFDYEKEYSRQGLLSSYVWNMYNNTDYSLTETYPAYVVVPTDMTDDELRAAAAYRSKRRFPVITFRCARTGAVLTRSAQPMVGVTQKTSPADQKLLNLYRTKGEPDSESEQEFPSEFYIFDARRAVAAAVNNLAGKGVENASHYEHTELIFCNIDNIHVMRNSYSMLGDLILPGGYSEQDLNLFDKLDESGWLKYIRLILASSVAAAEKLYLEGASLLVHCSDGWDRTAQLCATIQLILDPYYRTMEGFAVLIEKDWCAFGHKFNDRCGHAVDDPRSEERSPVFVQWMETVWQIHQQFPYAFEFNEDLMVFLCDHIHSGLFGNFLGNFEQQRVNDFQVRTKTASIWSYVFSNPYQFRNSQYSEYDGPVWPSTSLKKIRLWERFHLRWDPEMHPSPLSGIEWHDDWGNGRETLSPTRRASLSADSEGRRARPPPPPPPRTKSRQTSSDSQASHEF